jgi:hypothetical protein
MMLLLFWSGWINHHHAFSFASTYRGTNCYSTQTHTQAIMYLVCFLLTMVHLSQSAGENHFRASKPRTYYFDKNSAKVIPPRHMSCDVGGFDRLFQLVDSAAFLQSVACLLSRRVRGRGRGRGFDLVKQGRASLE